MNEDDEFEHEVEDEKGMSDFVLFVLPYLISCVLVAIIFICLIATSE